MEDLVLAHDSGLSPDGELDQVTRNVTAHRPSHTARDLPGERRECRGGAVQLNSVASADEERASRLMRRPISVQLSPFAGRQPARVGKQRTQVGTQNDSSLVAGRRFASWPSPWPVIADI